MIDVRLCRSFYLFSQCKINNYQVDIFLPPSNEEMVSEGLTDGSPASTSSINMKNSHLFLP